MWGDSCGGLCGDVCCWLYCVGELGCFAVDFFVLEFFFLEFGEETGEGGKLECCGCGCDCGMINCCGGGIDSG